MSELTSYLESAGISSPLTKVCSLNIQPLTEVHLQLVLSLLIVTLKKNK